ncbi:MAG TPA: ferredoxin [Acidimicrobiales bacterium]|nr:ferredoxin [Acidimicrobiales bacterium]
MKRLRLVVDPIACDGRGVCRDLLPEVVALDDWGFPILPAGPLPPEVVADARRAVSLCPRLALRLVEMTGA